MREYKFGDHVLFIDEDQCEIKGIIRDKKEYDSHLSLHIELDDVTGYYEAKLKKRVPNIK